MMKWNVGRPGGPQGPFWSVVRQDGRIIALQIPDEENARLIASLGDIVSCDPDTVQEAKKRLYKIMRRDFPDKEADDLPIEPGAYGYAIRSAIEALFWDGEAV